MAAICDVVPEMWKSLPEATRGRAACSRSRSAPSGLRPEGSIATRRAPARAARLRGLRRPVEEVAVDRVLSPEESRGRTGDSGSIDVPKRQLRDIEAGTGPDRRDLSGVQPEDGELVDSEANLPPVGLVEQKVEVVGHLAPVIRGLSIVHPAVFECGQVVVIGVVAEIERRPRRARAHGSILGSHRDQSHPSSIGGSAFSGSGSIESVGSGRSAGSADRAGAASRADVRPGKPIVSCTAYSERPGPGLRHHLRAACSGRASSIKGTR